MNGIKKAVILSSGGLDSTTTMAIAKSLGFELYAISFQYGQKHVFELEAAKKVSHMFGVQRHLIFPIGLSVFGGSALTSEGNVPKGRPEESIRNGSVPATYVPARNTVFLSIALSWAEVLEAYDIFIGVNALDYSGYPDCRPQYIQAFEKVANLGTKAGVEGKNIRIHTPLIQMTKKEIIQKGIELNVDYGVTFTCYDPSAKGEACGECDACQLRLKGFREAGKEDPLPYVYKKS